MTPAEIERRRRPAVRRTCQYPRPTPEGSAALAAAMAKVDVDAVGPGVMCALTANA